MEFFGVISGGLGLMGLVKVCIDNLELISRARGFSEDFDILCGELLLLQTRLRKWGQATGLLLTDGPAFPVEFRTAIHQPDVQSAIEANLRNLRVVLGKAGSITGRYSSRAHMTPRASSNTPQVVRFRQPRTGGHSILAVTRWCLYDFPRLDGMVKTMTRIISGLEGIANTLVLLHQSRVVFVNGPLPRRCADWGHLSQPLEDPLILLLTADRGPSHRPSPPQDGFSAQISGFFNQDFDLNGSASRD